VKQERTKLSTKSIEEVRQVRDGIGSQGSGGWGRGDGRRVGTGSGAGSCCPCRRGCEPFASWRRRWRRGRESILDNILWRADANLKVSKNGKKLNTKQKRQNKKGS